MDLMNARGAALYLKVSTNTLATWRHEKRGPRFIRTGRAIRYSQKDLDSYVRKNTVKTSS